MGKITGFLEWTRAEAPPNRVFPRGDEMGSPTEFRGF